MFPNISEAKNPLACVGNLFDVSCDFSNEKRKFFKLKLILFDKFKKETNKYIGQILSNTYNF